MRKVEVTVYDCKADKERPNDNELIQVRGSENWHPGFYNKKKDAVLCVAIANQLHIKFNKLTEWYRPIGGK